MQNNVSINEDDILVVTTNGDQTEATINAMGDQMRQLIAQLQADKKPVVVLDDIRNLGAVPPAGRKAVINLGKTLQYERLAMLGKPGSLIRIGANLLIGAIGRGGSTRYFDDEQKAIDWLLYR